MSEQALEPGDLVECINKEPWFFPRFPVANFPGPVYCGVYTVEEVGKTSIRVDGWEHFYDRDGFRKIVGCPDDVEIITECELEDA